MEIALVFLVGVMNICCFTIGAVVGQKVSKGETIETPTVNPMEAYRKREAKREAQKEQDKIDTILRNIEGYDGTGRGQEDVPR